MPIDEFKQPAGMVTTQEMTLAERQNRFGAVHDAIRDVPLGKYITILAVQTPVALTPEKYMELLTLLKTDFGVEAMQTAFASEIPTDPAYDYNLHLSAHLRMEKKQEPEPAP